MKIRFYQQLALIIVLGTAVAFGEDEIRHSDLSLATQWDLTYRPLEVQEAAQFDYGELRSNEVWIVGKLFDQSYNGRENSMRGRLDVLAQLAGKCPTNSFNYRWPISERRYYPPFASAGWTFVCRINPAQHGPDQFRPVYTIPRAWTSLVNDGFQEWQRAAQLYQQCPNQSDMRILRGKVEHENPFIAVAAFRALTRVGASDHEFIKRVVLPMTDERQAVLVSIALTHPNFQEAQLILADIVQFVQSRQSVDDIQWIALGAKAAMMTIRTEIMGKGFLEPDLPRYGYGQKVLSAVDAKLKSLPEENETKLFLRALIRGTF